MDEVDRHKVLNDLIGKPWEANAQGPEKWDCYHLARYVQKVFWNVQMPDIIVPENPSWHYVINSIEKHPERARWSEIHSNHNPQLVAGDGALISMGASVRPAHLGVWFKPEQAILHVDNPDGVVFQDIQTVRMMGWQRLRFYERSN